MTTTPAADAREKWLIRLGITLVFGVVIWRLAPLFRFGWFMSHDMVAYPVRVIEYARGWSSSLTPRWAPDTYGGFGSPLFNYYAPGITVGAAIFYKLGASATLSLKIVLVIATLIGAASMLKLLHRVTSRWDASVLGTLVWASVQYRYITLYERGDLAEYTAFCLCPLALLAYFQIDASRTRVDAFRLIPAAAFSHAAILLTHTITGLWFTQLLLIVLAPRCYAWLRRGERLPIVVTALSGFFAIALSAYYTVPAFLEKPLVQLDRMTQNGARTAANGVDWAYLTHPGFFSASRAITLGVPALGLVAVALAIARRRRHEALRLLGWIALTMLLLLAMLRPFSWIWHIVPLGKFLLFPWRLIGFVAIFGAVALAAIFRDLVPRKNLSYLAVLILGGAAIYDGSLDWPPLREVPLANIPSSPAQIAQQMHSTVVYDEYLPAGAAIPPGPRKGFIAGADRAVRVTRAVQQTGESYAIDVTANASGGITLNTFWFPGWVVRATNDSARATLERTREGLIRVQLARPGSYHLDVHFGTTPVRIAGAAFSLLALVLLVGGFAFGKRAATWSRLPSLPTHAAPAKSG